MKTTAVIDFDHEDETINSRPTQLFPAQVHDGSSSSNRDKYHLNDSIVFISRRNIFANVNTWLLSHKHNILKDISKVFQLVKNLFPKWLICLKEITSIRCKYKPWRYTFLTMNHTY